MEQQQHMFSNRLICSLLIPVVLEQLLNSIMGTADTMMVSNVGSAAISAVSLVDSINVLVIQAFSALAAGGAIVCAQYIGQKNKEKANESARQVLFIITAISVAVSLICLVFQKPLLRLIFGSVEPAVMSASETYFFYTALSFPFIAAYDSAASIFRAQDNTKGPMIISMISNVMNIAGNAVMIWVFHMGVAGAALSTLISRIFCAVVVIIQLRKEREGQEIVVRDYFKIRPDWSMIRRILGLGIPSGVENSMFQLGKLAIQSTVSTLGTAAIANISAFDITAGANATLNLPMNWQITTDLNLYNRNGYSDHTLNTTNWVWNASVAKAILKGNLTFRLNAVDILKQISNVQHTVNAQGRTETWVNSQPRYVMLHVVYRFNVMPKKKKN